MKLVHKSLTTCIAGFCCLLAAATLSVSAQDTAEQTYSARYDPAKGFKPAQVNLTAIMLQIAGSLEVYGSPEPYLRHMQKEHERVSRLFEQKTGKAHASRVPAHMTVAYVDKLAKNWNLLAQPLQLDALAKEAGRCAREAILGTRGTGTIAVEVLNEHQKLVAAEMQGKQVRGADFEGLRRALANELEFGKDDVDMTGYETARRDAVSYALVFDGKLRTVFKTVDSVAPQQAQQLKAAVKSVFLDLGAMAQSELEIGILAWSINQ